MCVSGAFARTFLEPGTGFPMFDRFPRLSLASSLSFFPRSLLLKCVAAVPAAAGLSSWTSNILSTSLSVWVCVYVCVCKCMCVCVGKVWKKITIVQKASLFLVQCVFMKFPQGGFQRPLGTLLREKKEKKDR